MRFHSMPPLPPYGEGDVSLPQANPWPMPTGAASSDALEGTVSPDDDDDVPLVECLQSTAGGARTSKRPARRWFEAIFPPPKQRRTAARRVVRKAAVRQHQLAKVSSCFLGLHSQVLIFCL